MKIEPKKTSDLSPAEWSAWESIVRENSEFDSPYFHPEFARAVAEVRVDVEVAVFADETGPVGFWPYQRTGRAANPLAGRLSDFHGVIARDGIDWTARELMAACDLRVMNFDHLLASQFARYQWAQKPSAYLDLTNGFDAYCEARRATGSKKIKQVGKHSRKLAREVAPWRVEFHSDDDAVWKQLREWKSAQYHANGLVDLFELEWVVTLLEVIRDKTTDNFAPAMSVLYVGDEIAAIDFGMRTDRVLHSWFPTYNVELSRYSLGHILSLEVAREAAVRGIQRIDWGKGDEDYKTSFASGQIPVAEGSVDLRPVSGVVRRSAYRTREWLKSTRLRDPLRKPARYLRRVFGKSTFS